MSAHEKFGSEAKAWAPDEGRGGSEGADGDRLKLPQTGHHTHQLARDRRSGHRRNRDRGKTAVTPAHLSASRWYRVRWLHD
jgi:hypothetical protein